MVVDDDDPDSMAFCYDSVPLRIAVVPAGLTMVL